VVGGVVGGVGTGGTLTGAVLHAMLDLARDPADAGKLIVGIAASFAERYLSTPLFAGF
jgi:cysteine synthase A